MMVRNYHVDVRLTKDEYDVIASHAKKFKTTKANVFRLYAHIVYVMYDPKLVFSDVLKKVADVEKVLAEKYGVTNFIEAISTKS